MSEAPTDTILLHTCCGPCATHCIEVLQADYRVVLFYSNSNIHTLEEFEKRLQEARRLSEVYDVELFVDPYDHQAWVDAIRGAEGEPERGRRCGLCFAFNLARAAGHAQESGIKGFTTTLTVSPHKISSQIFAVGAGLPGFISQDFKKRGGFAHSMELAREYGFYRQDYCGCEFSYKSRQVARLRDVGTAQPADG